MIKQTVCPNCGGLLRAESHGWICQKCRGFISLQDGKFYEYVEKPFVPPMTNADRIRAMSDEELATLLSELCQNGENCYSCPLFDKSCGGINGLSGWLDWAKRPAEVGNG